jgi:chromosome segregation ATPase
MAVPLNLVEETDALGTLEQRITRAVELVNQLRQERDALEKQLDSVRASGSEAESAMAHLKAENARLSEELDSLRSERKQVRTRIEKLLGQMDLLAS